jgi:hypothetical protein
MVGDGLLIELEGICAVGGVSLCLVRGVQLAWHRRYAATLPVSAGNPLHPISVGLLRQRLQVSESDRNYRD